MVRRFLILLLAIGLMSCSSGGSGDGDVLPGPTGPTTNPATAPPSGDRAQLTYTDFAQSGTSRIVHNNYYLPLGESGAAKHVFSGTLKVERGPMTPSGVFPGFEVDFFSWQGFLVPLQRDILYSGSSQRTLLLSPGKVWSEEADAGFSRASFPFILASPYDNRAHNGVASFLYDDTGCTDLRFQIVEESAAWDQFNAHGFFSMAYTARPATLYEEQMTAFSAERARRFPTGSWAELEQLAGGSLDHFDDQIPASDLTFKGAVVDGVLYQPPFETRFGPYPFPEYMRAGAFSVTKSIGASLTMLRLAQKYGPSVFDLYIKDYLNVTASHDGWDEVTFADCLNMATGIGDNSRQREEVDTFADENKSRMGQWSNALSLEGKLQVSFQYGNLPWGTDDIVRYNTTHIFVLAAAMDAFLKTKEGEDAELWAMVKEEVLEPIGISVAPMMHTIEGDGSRGVPLFGVGAYPTTDDLAKITTLMQNGGRYEGQQLLDENHLNEALFRTNQTHLPLGNHSEDGDPYLYHHAFWSEPFREGNCYQQMPYMSGFGGNMVLVLPNGISCFRFADNHNYNVDGMIQDMQKIRPYCNEAP